MSNKEVNRIFEVTGTNPKEYSITLTGALVEADEYLEELQLIRELKEGEKVHLNINGLGGQVATLVQFVNVINATKGHVHGNLEGMAHSCHSMLFLACHSWTVGENCIMLVHNYSAGNYGKGAELVASTEATHAWCTDISKSIYEGFLTEDEMSKVLDDKDVWVTSDGLHERLERLQEHRELEAAIFMEEFEKQHEALVSAKFAESYASAKALVEEYENAVNV